MCCKLNWLKILITYLPTGEEDSLLQGYGTAQPRSAIPHTLFPT